jgi:hypothetical protein
VSSTAPGDRVLPITRWVALAIVPFLVVAFVVLYPVPSDTGTLFAWKIVPSMTAMLLGAVYLGGAYFFLRVAFGSTWHNVEAGFLPVGVFASLMGVATVLHWDRFNHQHLAFWLWAGLYFTTPFLIFGVWLAQWRRAVPVTGEGPPVPRAAAVTGRALGLLASGTAIVLFTAPGRAIAVWPWHLTPLTARAVGAIFSLGVAGLTGFTSRRWSQLRTLLHVAGIMLALILIAAVRAHREFDSARPLTWLFAVGFLVTSAGLARLYTSMAAIGTERDTNTNTVG